MKKLLMIRDKQLATDFVDALGVQNPIVYAPMVKIEELDIKQPIPITDTLIFTSSNAVRAYCKRSTDRTVRAFCVGSITAKVADDHNIKVSKSYETVETLIDDLKASKADLGSILYPRGEVVSVDIVQALSDMQIEITEVILYKQVFQNLPSHGVSEIESSAVIVPILSKEIAGRFLEALKVLKSQNVTIICISPAVAKIFKDSIGFKVQIAAKPTRAALIQVVKTALSV